MTRIFRIWALAACLAIAGPPQGYADDADAPPRPKAVRLAKAGSWTLAMITLETRSSMCAASSLDGVSKAVFDYIVVDRRAAAFRITGAKIAPMAEAAAPVLILQVDARRAIAVPGRVKDSTMVMPVERDAEAKRQFVRDMAEGKKLEVRRRDGALVGSFQLRGAGKVLRAFGLCVARLPERAPPPRG